MVFIMIFCCRSIESSTWYHYAYQERRFGRTAERSCQDVSVPQSLCDGCDVYGISIVLQSIVGIPFALSVVILVSLL